MAPVNLAPSVVGAAARGAISASGAAGLLVSKCALAGIVAAYCYEVVSRYLFSAPTYWSADLVTYLLCIMVFTAMPHVTATGGQVAVTIVIDCLNARHRTLAMRLIYLLGFAACAAMALFAAGETLRQFDRDIQMMAVWAVPKWWISVWICIGFALTALQYASLALASGNEEA